jgi:hypothetical protein
MNPATAIEICYIEPDPAAAQRAADYAARRIAVNRANSQHSTGPRTPDGKQRASMNALSHGLTAANPLLPTEDGAAYDRHHQDFVNEYQPATPTETQLTRDLADTSWRMNRIPALEAQVLTLAIESIARDLNALGTYGAKLSRQFHKTLDQLRQIQAERRQQELRDMRQAAAIFQVHKDKAIPYRPSDDGFVFSNDQIQSFIDRQMRHGQAKSMEYFLHYAPEKLLTRTAAAS